MQRSIAASSLLLGSFPGHVISEHFARHIVEHPWGGFDDGPLMRSGTTPYTKTLAV